MKLKYFFKYYLFWLCFFIVQKPIFMLINLSQMGSLAWQDWFTVPYHAFPLDLSVASYVTALFGLILTVFYLWPSRLLARIADGCTAFLLLVALRPY